MKWEKDREAQTPCWRTGAGDLSYPEDSHRYRWGCPGGEQTEFEQSGHLPTHLHHFPSSSTTRVKMSLLLFACHFVADLMTIDNS